MRRKWTNWNTCDAFSLSPSVCLCVCVCITFNLNGLMVASDSDGMKTVCVRCILFVIHTHEYGPKHRVNSNLALKNGKHPAHMFEKEITKTKQIFHLHMKLSWPFFRSPCAHAQRPSHVSGRKPGKSTVLVISTLALAISTVNHATQLV